MKPYKNKILIIGGGASGMMAAISAAEHGADVRILERMPRVGKKLLATGNGRCNLSNLNMGPEHFHGDREFIRAILSECNLDATLKQLENLGLFWISEPDTGRIFPRSLQASSILDVLRNAMDRRGVTETCDAVVQKILRTGRAFQIILGDGHALNADRIILAAGGRASPNLGSNGSGFQLAKQLGHSVSAPRPAIVQLTWKRTFSKRLKGLKVQARIELEGDGKLLRTESGEIHFTEDGLSGIPALQMARLVHDALDKGHTPVLHINLFPDLDRETLAPRLSDRLRRLPDQTVKTGLISLIHKRLIPVILTEAGIDPESFCSRLADDAPEHLIRVLTDWQIPVTGTRSWSSAQVTSGGVITDNVNPRTLESNLVPGLYFAGEILDVDGDCGGYNLQWAWSTGWIAGRHAALD